MTRLLSYSIDGRASFGLMADDRVIDLAPRMPGLADEVTA